MSVVLGVDIGGSHITTALIDLASRTIIEGAKKRQWVDSGAGAEKICEDWCGLMEATLKEHQPVAEKIGIAIPGPFDYEAGISLMQEQGKFQHLYGLNIKNILAERLNIGANNIRFMNDAACFLQGEVFMGAAKDYRRVFGLTLGTGLGSALCINGKAHDADLWKSPFKDGIAEDYLSTRWFVKKYKALTGKAILGVKELIEDGTAAIVEAIFAEFSQNLGLFLVPCIQQFQPEAIVFGGNISNASPYFLPALSLYLKKHQAEVEIYQSLLNEDASLLGAASCWKAFEERVLVTGTD